MTLGRQLCFSILPEHWVKTVQVAGNLGSIELFESLMDWDKVHIISDTRIITYLVVVALLALAALLPFVTEAPWG